MNHKRTCHDCGNVAEHESNVAPEVFCRLCGSPDTRPLSAFAAIAGKWPGDETDEEIDAAMDAMDRTKPLRELIAAIRDRAIEGIVECGTEFDVLNDIVELIDGKAANESRPADSGTGSNQSSGS